MKANVASGFRTVGSAPFRVPVRRTPATNIAGYGVVAPVATTTVPSVA
jgi:hypothetical protein